MPETAPARLCAFEHAMFARLPDITFRLSEGGRTPSLVTRIDDQTALLPLRKIQREFGIADGSADAEMIALVVRALDFVQELRPGDPIPGEALGTGQASWEPGPDHLRAAAARMRLQLAALFLDAEGGSEAEVIRAAGCRAEDLARADPQILIAMVDDPARRGEIGAALSRAAEDLGVAGGLPGLMALIEEAAGDLAYVEALRERLLAPVQALEKRVAALSRAAPRGTSRKETLGRVERLMGLAAGAIRGRFELVEAHAAEAVPMLRHLERHRQFIRAHRDWLYATLRGGWEPLLAAWSRIDAEVAAAASGETDAGNRDLLWELVCETYRFLAPRHTPAQEWRFGGGIAGGGGAATPLAAAEPAKAETATRMVW
jgi:hypothetical protein